MQGDPIPSSPAPNYFFKTKKCCVNGNKKKTNKEFHLPYFLISFLSQVYLFVRKMSSVNKSVLSGALRHASGRTLKEQARTGAGVVMALAAGAGARNRLLL